MAMRVTSPAWVRVDAAEPSPWRRAVGARIIHRGTSALVLDAGGERLTVTGSRLGLVPGGIQVADAELDRLRAIEASAVTWNMWQPLVVVEARLTVDPLHLDALALHAVRSVTVPARAAGDDPLDAVPIRRRAAGLAAAAVNGGDIDDVLRSLVGAGPGSTPTGDDVIVGVLAGLRARGARFAASAIACRVPALLARTTSASVPYLAAAAEGRFADRVHDLLCRLDDSRRVREVVRLAATWGATSGLDLLSGIVTGGLAVSGRSGKVPA